MKKVWAFLLVGIFVLSGCNSNTEKSNQNLSKDKSEYAKQISEDREIVDAVLMDNYYTLPCSLKEFLDHGWEEEKDNGVSQIETVELKPDTVIRIAFNNKEKSLKDVRAKIHLSLLNNTSKPIKINAQTQVIGIEVDNFYLDSKDFITKGGISLNAKKDEVEKAFKDTPSIDIDEYKAVLKNSQDVNIASFSFDYKKENVSKIMLMSVDRYKYKMYKDPKEIEKSIENYKRECEKKSAKYLPDHYDDLVNDLKNGGYKSAQLFVEGEIKEIISVGYGSLKNATNSAYLFEDANGKQYVMKYSSSDSYILKVGDKIQIWGDSYQVIQMRDRGNIDLPYMSGMIINVNGEEKYNFYRIE